MKYVGLTIALSLALFACGSGDPKWQDRSTVLTDQNPSQPKPDLSQVTFKMVSQHVFEPSCLKCHGAESKSGVDLRTYAKAMEAVDKIRSVVLEEMRMPPKTPLTEDQLAIVEAWFQNGAPE